MSFLLMARAIKSNIPDCYAKWLMVVLADHANEDTHECWPSLQRLADRTQMSVPTITRKLNWLEDQGYLSRVRGSSQRSTRYTIFPLTVADRNNTVAHSNTAIAEGNTNLSDNPPVNKKKLVPENWEPSEELCKSIDLKLQENQDHEYETDQFRCYHASKGSRFSNIELAYRGWCRRAFKWRAEKGRSYAALTGKGSGKGGQKSSHFAGILSGISGQAD